VTLSAIIDGALASMQACMGQAVTYARGGNSAAITACPGANPHRRAMAEGGAEFAIDAQVRDWLVAAADLVLAGATVEPRRGDRITTESGEVWELLELDGGPVWDWSDPANRIRRLHTKRIT